MAGEFARFMLPGHDAWFLSPTFGGAYDWLGDHSWPAYPGMLFMAQTPR